MGFRFTLSTTITGMGTVEASSFKPSCSSSASKMEMFSPATGASARTLAVNRKLKFHTPVEFRPVHHQPLGEIRGSPLERRHCLRECRHIHIPASTQNDRRRRGSSGRRRTGGSDTFDRGIAPGFTRAIRFRKFRFFRPTVSA